MLARDGGDVVELGRIKAEALGLRGSSAPVFWATSSSSRAGQGAPVEAPAVAGVVEHADGASNDSCLGSIRDPSGGGDDQVAVEDELEEEEELLAAGADEDIVSCSALDTISTSVEGRHGISKLS